MLLFYLLVKNVICTAHYSCKSPDKEPNSSYLNVCCTYSSKSHYFAMEKQMSSYQLWSCTCHLLKDDDNDYNKSIWKAQGDKQTNQYKLWNDTNLSNVTENYLVDKILKNLFTLSNATTLHDIVSNKLPISSILTKCPIIIQKLSCTIIHCNCLQDKYENLTFMKIVLRHFQNNIFLTRCILKKINKTKLLLSNVQC